MWREPEEIIGDLSSGDAARVSDGLRDLEEAMDSGAGEFPLPPIEVELLAPFGDALPEEAHQRMLRIVDGYQSFEPKQSDQERYGKTAVLGSKWGSQRFALEAALVVKRARDSAQAVRWALAALLDGAIDTPRALEGAEYFVSLLLDGAPEVRRATLEALAAWPRRPPFSDVVTYVLPQLDPTEAAVLKH